MSTTVWAAVCSLELEYTLVLAFRIFPGSAPTLAKVTVANCPPPLNAVVVINTALITPGVVVFASINAPAANGPGESWGLASVAVS